MALAFYAVCMELLPEHIQHMQRLAAQQYGRAFSEADAAEILRLVVTFVGLLTGQVKAEPLPERPWWRQESGAPESPVKPPEPAIVQAPVKATNQQRPCYVDSVRATLQ